VLLLIAGLLVAAAAPVTAQRGGNVGGTVEDEQGNPLSDILVTLYSEAETRTDTTNKKGRFQLVVMDATERFVIRLEAEGYTTIEEPIEVGIGESVRRTFTMIPAQATSAVEVEGNSEAVAAYNAGAEAFNAGDYALARSSFEGALELDPELLPARKVLTLVYFQLQEWGLASQSARIVADAEPDNEAALKVGFDAASQLGDREQAERFLEELLALGPTPEAAARLFNHGVGDLRAGDRESAKARFQAAMEMDPELAAAYTGLASLNLEDGNYDEALAIADRLLALDPGNAEGLGIRYEAYRRMGDEAAANAALDELQAADPERIVDAYYQQGILLFNDGAAQEAVAAFERVLSADPEHARAHYQLGRAYLSAGEYEKAKQYLQRFIEMAPEDPEVPSAREMLSYLD
jgi:tetratricopeptide (TPR) repeat protein